MVLTESNSDILVKGDSAPFFSLKNYDGRIVSLDDIKGSKLTVIVFMCNHCPYVKAKIQELIRIQRDFSDNGVSVIGINSNDAFNYPDDSFDKMTDFATEHGVNFHYLVDGNQEIAKAYGAVTTPDPFIFDKDLLLVRHSRIDDAHGDGVVSHNEMYDSIKEYLETGQMSLPEAPSPPAPA